MDIKQAIELTKTFNQWRRGETGEKLSMDDLGLAPAKIGVALDTLINFAEVTVMTQEFLAGEAGNFSGVDVDKDSPVCCHTCNRKTPIHQFNPAMIKCTDCGKRDCKKADWHGSECENVN